MTLRDLTPHRDPPGWVRQYVGLEWRADGRTRRGIDCWGICWLVFREMLGLEVPSYEGHALVDRRGLPALDAFISAECDRHWVDVAHAPARGEDLVWHRPEQVGDIVISRFAKWEYHTAIVIARRTVLSVDWRTASHIERYDRAPMRRWVNSVRRHGALA